MFSDHKVERIFQKAAFQNVVATLTCTKYEQVI